MTYASFELSKKIFDLVGQYDTDAFYYASNWKVKTWKFADPNDHSDCGDQGSSFPRRYVAIPAPNFAELVRILYYVGRAKGWRTGAEGNANVESVPFLAAYLLDLYINPATPEAIAMTKVESHLLKLL